MPKRIPLHQSTPEWHDWRKAHIGSSDAPVIMGVGYDTPHKRWLDKIGLSKPKESNFMMERGRTLEEPARILFSDKLGVNLEPACFEHSDIPYIGTSVDGICKDNKILVEIKTGGQSLTEMAIAGQIRDDHFAQCQHHLETTELDKMYLGVYSETFHALIEVFRDSKYIRQLLKLEKEFWDYVLDFLPPPLTDRDFENKDDDEWLSVVNEWQSHQSKAALHEEKAKQARAKLIELSNGRNCIGGGIRITKVISQGHIQYKEIPQLKNVDLDAYRKEPIISYKITKVK